MRPTLSLLFSLVAMWLLWSGHYVPLILGLGLASCLLVVFLAQRLGIVDAEADFIGLGPRLVVYWCWLLWQIALANFKVAALILSPKLRISPRLVSVKATQTNDLTKTIHANAITLTPGTVSLQVGDEILVHALTEAHAEEVAQGDMDRHATALEGRA